MELVQIYKHSMSHEGEKKRLENIKSGNVDNINNLLYCVCSMDEKWGANYYFVIDAAKRKASIKQNSAIKSLSHQCYRAFIKRINSTNFCFMNKIICRK